MSAPDPFRLRFQSLVASGLAASGIATRVGLVGASEVWGGDEPRERPAWYVWLAGHAGSWQVELAGAEPLAGAAQASLVGRFTVRYYPAAGTEEHASFSAEERLVAARSLDATGTPRIEAAARIPETFFTVGTFEWAVEPTRGDSAFVLASLDRLRARGPRGEIVRDVPGWRLTAPIFSLVAGLYAQVERQAPSRLVLTRRPGFETVAAPESWRARDAAETTQGEAILLFPARGSGAGAMLFDALLDREGEILADLRLDGVGAHPCGGVGAGPDLRLAVSHAWFGGEAHRQDGIACGC